VDGCRTWRPEIRSSAHKRCGEFTVKSVNSHDARNSMSDVEEP
jgi:hypothetical protein